MTINVDDIETEIRQAKNQIRSAGGDLKQGFTALDSLIDEQIAEIEQIVATAWNWHRQHPRGYLAE